MKNGNKNYTSEKIKKHLAKREERLWIAPRLPAEVKSAGIRKKKKTKKGVKPQTPARVVRKRSRGSK